MYCTINHVISTNMYMSLQQYTEGWETGIRKLLSLGGNTAIVSLLLCCIMYVNVICNIITSYIRY